MEVEILTGTEPKFEIKYQEYQFLTDPPRPYVDDFEDMIRKMLGVPHFAVREEILDSETEEIYMVRWSWYVVKIKVEGS